MVFNSFISTELEMLSSFLVDGSLKNNFKLNNIAHHDIFGEFRRSLFFIFLEFVHIVITKFLPLSFTYLYG